jgi:hypothetical protein
MKVLKRLQLKHPKIDSNLKAWLRTRKKSCRCPFGAAIVEYFYPVALGVGCKTCLSMFPEIDASDGNCPCHVIGVMGVRERVTAILDGDI